MLVKLAELASAKSRDSLMDSPRNVETAMYVPQKNLKKTFGNVHKKTNIHLMKGKQEVIDSLNAGLTIELTAVNQYFIHSKMCESWGLHKLAKHYYEESIEEMKHAEEVIDRILYLDGVPEIARYDIINSGSSPEEQISYNLRMESKGVETYNKAIDVCIKFQDSGSRDLMERMVVESEESVDWAEAQLDLIKMVGLENYLAQQIGEPK